MGQVSFRKPPAGRGMGMEDQEDEKGDDAAAAAAALAWSRSVSATAGTGLRQASMPPWLSHLLSAALLPSCDGTNAPGDGGRFFRGCQPDPRSNDFLPLSVSRYG